MVGIVGMWGVAGFFPSRLISFLGGEADVSPIFLLVGIPLAIYMAYADFENYFSSDFRGDSSSGCQLMLMMPSNTRSIRPNENSD